MNNRIPHKFNRITVKQNIDTSGGVTGDVWTVYRNEWRDLIGINTRTQKKYCLFLSHLRNAELYSVLNIE